jgi:PKD repeat protein
VAPLARGAGLTLFTTGGAAASQQVSGTAPLAVGAALTATPGMDDAAHSGSALTSKAELDFGDGAGWQDVTAQQHAAGPAWGASLAQSVPHAYAAPGSYTLRGRVTYWDGTLYEAWNPYTITVH